MCAIQLDDLEKDILRESINLGVGRAAAAMSELTGQEVHIAIPELELLPKRHAVDFLATRFPEEAWIIQDDFAHVHNPSIMAGHIFLILQDNQNSPPDRMLAGHLTDGLGHDLPPEEILQEIGNILLNACLSGMADLMGMELQGNVPTVTHTHLLPPLRRIVRQDPCPPVPGDRRRPERIQDPVLHLLLRFHLQDGALDGTIMIFLDLITIPELIKELHRMANSFQG